MSQTLHYIQLGADTISSGVRANKYRYIYIYMCNTTHQTDVIIRSGKSLYRTPPSYEELHIIVKIGLNTYILYSTYDIYI